MISPFVIKHYVAIGAVVGYIALTVANQMPAPGEWQATGGLYGWFYRVVHSLAASKIATVLESRFGGSMITAAPATPLANQATTTTVAAVTTQIETKV